MCDPVSLVVGTVAGGALAGSQARKAAKAGRGSKAPDPEAERMKAEAEAAASANRKLAADQMRRREQQSLIARGAPAPSLGDEQTAGDGIIRTGSSLVSRRSSPWVRTASLIARGAPSYDTTRSTAGGGGGTVTTRQNAR